MKPSKVALIGVLTASGCALSHDVGGASEALVAPIELSAQCEKEIRDTIDGMPEHLDCTGMYENIASKKVADGVRPFTPVYPLWSDASVKRRWVYLPEGSKIDASKPSAWKFPPGTRFWKDFRDPTGKRLIETRVFIKKEDDDWIRATYEWDSVEKNAKRIDAPKQIMVNGEPYDLPGREQCDECHKGSRERVMAFDSIALGLTETERFAGEKGDIRLSNLLKEGRLKGFSGASEYKIGPNPESTEAQALGWLHTNCGVSCHNDTPDSKAFSNKMRLALDPAQLDGRSTKEFAAIKTTVDQDVYALQWQGKKRIIPGAPEDSWLYTLITQRGNPKEQMPPLGTSVVDQMNASIVKKWIEELPND